MVGAPAEEISVSTRTAGIVLLIDDDRRALAAMGDGLIRHIYRVHAYDDLDAALDWLRAGNRPDVVLLDYDLGLGWTGLDPLAAVLAVVPDVPIALYTGHEPDRALHVAAMSAGASAVSHRQDYSSIGGSARLDAHLAGVIAGHRRRQQESGQDGLLRSIVDLARTAAIAQAATLARVDALSADLTAYAAPGTGTLDRVAARVPLLPADEARRLIQALAGLAIAGAGYLAAHLSELMP